MDAKQFNCKGQQQGYEPCGVQCDECNPNVDFGQTLEPDIWADKLYNQLKHIFDCYADEWTEHNLIETADLLTDFQTRNIP